MHLSCEHHVQLITSMCRLMRIWVCAHWKMDTLYTECWTLWKIDNVLKSMCKRLCTLDQRPRAQSFLQGGMARCTMYTIHCKVCTVCVCAQLDDSVQKSMSHAVCAQVCVFGCMLVCMTQCTAGSHLSSDLSYDAPTTLHHHLLPAHHVDVKLFKLVKTNN